MAVSCGWLECLIASIVHVSLVLLGKHNLGSVELGLKRVSKVLTVL